MTQHSGYPIIPNCDGVVFVLCQSPGRAFTERIGSKMYIDVLLNESTRPDMRVGFFYKDQK